jgi:hypothetical protein
MKINLIVWIFWWRKWWTKTNSNYATLENTNIYTIIQGDCP